MCIVDLSWFGLVSVTLFAVSLFIFPVESSKHSSSDSAKGEGEDSGGGDLQVEDTSPKTRQRH